MRRLPKPILVVLIVTLLLATAVSTASATRISLSNQNIRATFTSLEFVSEGATTIRCQVTLEGSFHARTMTKVVRTLLGAVTKAAVKHEACTNGREVALNGVESYNGTASPNTLPWHLTYESFTGTLPNISSINLLLSRFRFGLETPGLCTGQYGSETDNITATAAREAGGGLTTLTPVEGRNIMTLIRRDAGLVCPATHRLRGTGQLFLLGATTRVSVTLI